MKLTTTGQVSDCLSAYVASAALGAAIEVGLFWLLAEQPLDTPGVAQALSIPIRRCQYWLQLLHSIGVVDQVPAISPPILFMMNYQADTIWCYSVHDLARGNGVLIKPS